MARWVMNIGAATVAVSSLLAALLRIYVGFKRPRIRLWYWLSAPALFGLFVSQLWLLYQRHFPELRILFGQTMVLGVVITCAWRPALIAHRDPYLGERPGR